MAFRGAIGNVHRRPVAVDDQVEISKESVCSAMGWLQCDLERHYDNYKETSGVIK